MTRLASMIASESCDCLRSFIHLFGKGGVAFAVSFMGKNFHGRD